MIVGAVNVKKRAVAGQSAAFVMKTAEQLKADGARQIEATIASADGGVLFVDEAYALYPASDTRGNSIAMALMQAAEDKRNSMSFILAGYKQEIEQLGQILH